MTLDAARIIELDRLDDALRLAPALAPELFLNVVERACLRLPSLRSTGKAARIDRLIASGAWIDAALALIELELPKLEDLRVVYENCEWLCSLSRQPDVPMVIDDPVEASHEIFPLAILRAFIEARRGVAVPRAISAVPEVRPATERLICCDNFG